MAVMRSTSTRRLLIFLTTLIFILLGTTLTIHFAKGYRLKNGGSVQGTGLLAANSFPPGAEVYLNDRLTTATDNTLNLEPGEYQIELKKDGYHSWRKTLAIETELVTQTNATLFPTSPTLEPLTFTGALNPIPSPDGNQVAFTVASASAIAKNGLYVQDLTSSPIALSRSARQIARTSDNFDYTQASYTWSPDGSELLVSFASGANLLLSTSHFNDLQDLKDVTATLPQTLRDWELELAREEQVRLKKLPEFFLSNLPANLYFSPNGERLLYQAQTSLTLPSELITPLPASSTQTETRTLSPGEWYIYDLEEDKNFLLPTLSLSETNQATPTANLRKLLLTPDPLSPLPPAELASTPSAFRQLQQGLSPDQSVAFLNAQYSPIYVGSLQWFPDSTHLILQTANSIDLIEYDGTNRLTLYAGPFDHHFVYAWPDASRLVTLIQFSPDTTPNLYTIKLK